MQFLHYKYEQSDEKEFLIHCFAQNVMDLFKTIL